MEQVPIPGAHICIPSLYISTNTTYLPVVQQCVTGRYWYLKFTNKEIQKTLNTMKELSGFGQSQLAKYQPLDWIRIH